MLTNNSQNDVQIRRIERGRHGGNGADGRWTDLTAKERKTATSWSRVKDSETVAVGAVADLMRGEHDSDAASWLATMGAGRHGRPPLADRGCKIKICRKDGL